MATKLVNTPLRKAVHNNQAKMSPLRPIVSSTPHVSNVVNDDEAERSRRRSDVELHRRVSSIGTLNRSSVAETVELTGGKLEDHYQKCVQLFTENKINMKNAWNLHIIELMRPMLNKNGLKMGDTLQLASTSLDISSKVYGLRVDDIHNDVLKLANTMARFNLEQENREVDDENAENSSGDEQVAQKKEKKKKKKRLSRLDDNSALTIAAKTESLDCKISQHNLAYNTSATSKERLYTLSMLAKYRWGWEEHVPCRANFPFLMPLNDEQDSIPAKQAEWTLIPAVGVICPSFGDFEVDQWRPEEEDSLIAETQATRVPDAVVYDDKGYPIPELDASVHDFDDMHASDMEEDVGGACHGALRPEIAHITDMRPGVSYGNGSDKPLEYSYRTAPIVSERYAITGVWAGPSHWKVKCLQRRTTNSSNAESVVGSVAQRARRTRRSEIEPIPYEMSAEDIAARIAVSKKRNTRVRLASAVDKYALPEDMCVTTRDCYNMNLLPIRREVLIGSAAVAALSDRQVDLNITNYQYDNPNDADYCSQTLVDDDNGIAAADDNDDGGNISAHQQTFVDDNMVEMPDMVPKTYVPYATQAKKMDMKKLKDSLWTGIIEEGCDKENVEPNSVEEEPAKKKFEKVSFSKMYESLAEHLPQRMAEDLSSPLAFVALLHLANEKSLKLESAGNLQDIYVSSDY